MRIARLGTCPNIYWRDVTGALVCQHAQLECESCNVSQRTPQSSSMPCRGLREINHRPSWAGAPNADKLRPSAYINEIYWHYIVVRKGSPGGIVEEADEK